MEGSVAASQHVPAWKRLGLKLKYASDTASEPPSPAIVYTEKSQSENQNAHPGKRSLGDNEQNQPLKRTKISTEGETSNSPRTVSHDTKPTSEAVTSKGRRKSVTFTSDTKTDDGFSATTLYQNWLANENEAQSSIQAYIEDHRTAAPQLEPTPPKKDPKPKRDKAKSKSDKAAKAARIEKQPDSTETPDYVRYLVQFHEDKSSWKFHKKKQNEVIKHCFDLSRIPAEHTPALVAYVKGLQGLGIQQRLLESCEKILQDLLTEQGRSADIEGMESPQARKAAYEATVQRQLDRKESLGGVRLEYETDLLEEIERKAVLASRSDAIFKELLLKGLGRPVPTPTTHVVTPAVLEAPEGAQDTPYQNMISRAAPKRTTFDDEDDDTTTTAAQPPAKRNRTRKSRTNTADDSSSSSSSLEDSSSESDSDSDGDSPGTATPARPQSSKIQQDAKKLKPTIFDKELLDAAFPESRARADKTRALAEAHAARDESASESESDSDSESGSDSEGDSGSDSE